MCVCLCPFFRILALETQTVFWVWRNVIFVTDSQPGRRGVRTPNRTAHVSTAGSPRPCLRMWYRNKTKQNFIKIVVSWDNKAVIISKILCSVKDALKTLILFPFWSVNISTADLIICLNSVHIPTRYLRPFHLKCTSRTQKFICSNESQWIGKKKRGGGVGGKRKKERKKGRGRGGKRKKKT